MPVNMSEHVQLCVSEQTLEVDDITAKRVFRKTSWY